LHFQHVCCYVVDLFGFLLFVVGCFDDDLLYKRRRCRCIVYFLFLFVVIVVAVVVADDEEDSEREMKYLSFSDFVMDGVDGVLV